MKKQLKKKQVPGKKKRFLEMLFATGGNLAKAAEMVDLAYSTLFNWRKNDPDFEEELLNVLDESTIVLEKEALRRAFEGVDEPVFYQGIETGVVRKYSDTLAMFMLKGRKPEKYRDNSTVRVQGHDGGPLQIRAWAELVSSAINEGGDPEDGGEGQS